MVTQKIALKRHVCIIKVNVKSKKALVIFIKNLISTQHFSILQSNFEENLYTIDPLHLGVLPTHEIQIIRNDNLPETPL